MTSRVRTLGICTLVALGLLSGPPHTARAASSKSRARATFAGGCFWSMEAPFDQVSGVVSTTAGYAGGSEPNPRYEHVAAGATGHAEAVQVVFDPAKVSFEKLLAVFWRNIDPFDTGGQFCDRGRQYRTAIFYETEEQKRAAVASKESIEAQGRLPAPIATEIAPLPAFYPAEPEHQDFYQTKASRYWSYRAGCGRDRRLKEIWGEVAGK
jgi:peptide-methionine (S)-S-oxide reductase